MASRRWDGGRSRRRPRAAAALTAALVLLVGGGCQRQDTPAEPAPSEPASQPVRITFGVYGQDDEVAAFTAMAEEFNAQSEESTVEVVSWPDRQAAVASMKSDGDLPDAFLASRRDLIWLREGRLIQPVDELLDDRGVDFGDGNSRDALLAFSTDNALQCMPYGISPMVLYYNTELVDFGRMRQRGLDVPESADRWTLEQFGAAAAFASRPARGTRGVHIEPTLRGLAPFVYSGGGQLYDDDEAPTSLALSQEDTKAALDATLQVLRNPHITLTEEQFAEAPALDWFKRGKLGMIAGFRTLVPELRLVPNLRFDVMPMPTLEEEGTVGDVTGICMAADTENAGEVADFLVHATSAKWVARVARAGYLVPANLEVATADDFLQPGREPAHAIVFNTSVRDVVIPPLIDNAAELEAAVEPSLVRLFTVPVLDIDALTAQIDELSRTVLDPEATASPATEQPATEGAEAR